MADDIVQLSADGSGKKIDNESLTVGANTVYRQRTMIAGSGAAELARILAAAPAIGDYGLVVRSVGPVDTELPAAAALANAAANPTVPTVGADLSGFNGTTWDLSLIHI